MEAIKKENVVVEAASLALEKMAFLMVLPDELLAVPKKSIIAEIGFSGPKMGKIQIAAGIDFADILARNMGSIEDPDEEKCIDAMKEFVNVTTGLILPLITESENDDAFDLSVPHLVNSDDRIHWREFISREGVSVLNVENKPVAVRLVIEK